MRATKVGASGHICKPCDRRDDRDTPLVRPGKLIPHEGWRDVEDDWVISKRDLEDGETLANYLIRRGSEYTVDELFEHTYYTCPTCSHDSDDYENDEMYDVPDSWVCGMCGTFYPSTDAAADCCDDK